MTLMDLTAIIGYGGSVLALLWFGLTYHPGVHPNGCRRCDREFRRIERRRARGRR